MLVVDDFVDNREMYMEYFRFVGFEVIGAADGEAAIELARRERPSAVIMDLSLPGMNGWEATRALKSDPVTSDIVVVVVTGHGEPEHRERAFEAGCDLFIVKPCLPAKILEDMLSILDASVVGKVTSPDRATRSGRGK